MQMERKREEGQLYLYQIKIYIKSKTVIRDKEGHYIMIKGQIHQEDIQL